MFVSRHLVQDYLKKSALIQNIRYFASSNLTAYQKNQIALFDKKELTVHGSIVPHRKADVVGSRCWELPLKRRDTWTIFAPDARIINTRYRNEPEVIKNAPHFFTESGVRLPAPAHEEDQLGKSMTWKEVFQIQGSDLFLLLITISFFGLYPWR